MPRFEFDIPHALVTDDVRTRLQHAIAKLEGDYGAKCTWDNEGRLLVARKGLDAKVTLADARLRVEMNLGLLLSPLVGGIRAGITKQLTELLK